MNYKTGTVFSAPGDDRSSRERGYAGFCIYMPILILGAYFLYAFSSRESLMKEPALSRFAPAAGSVPLSNQFIPCSGVVLTVCRKDVFCGTAGGKVEFAGIRI